MGWNWDEIGMETEGMGKAIYLFWDFFLGMGMENLVGDHPFYNPGFEKNPKI
jgi:hypothetical protein